MQQFPTNLKALNRPQLRTLLREITEACKPCSDMMLQRELLSLINDPAAPRYRLLKAIEQVTTPWELRYARETQKGLDRKRDREKGFIRGEYNDVDEVDEYLPPNSPLWWSCQWGQVSTEAEAYYQWMYPGFATPIYDASRCQTAYDRYKPIMAARYASAWLDRVAYLYGVDDRPRRRKHGIAGFILPNGQFINLPEDEHTETGFIYHSEAARKSAPDNIGGLNMFLDVTGAIRFHYFMGIFDNDSLTFDALRNATPAQVHSAAQLVELAVNSGDIITVERNDLVGYIETDDLHDALSYLATGQKTMLGPYGQMKRALRHERHPEYETLRGARRRR